MPGGLRRGPGLVAPAGLAEPPGSRGRRLTPLLLFLLLLLPLLWFLWQEEEQPTTLDGWRLDGPRQAGCVRLVVGVDDSGSMSDFATARDAALAQFLDWAGQDNLRDDDQLAVVDFAGDAAVRLPPSPPHGTGGLGPQPPLSSDGTRLMPALAEIAAFPATPCRTLLMLLSDAQLEDLPRSEEAGRRMLRNAGVDGILLLVPGERIEVPGEWEHTFPPAAPIYFDGHDRDESAIAFGRTVAEIVDQRLVPRDG